MIKEKKIENTTTGGDSISLFGDLTQENDYAPQEDMGTTNIKPISSTETIEYKTCHSTSDTE